MNLRNEMRALAKADEDLRRADERDALGDARASAAHRSEHRAAEK